MRAWVGNLLDVHHQKRTDHREVADRVQEKTPALAERRHHESGDRRPDDACAIQHRGVERDRIHDIVAADGLGQKRVPQLVPPGGVGSAQQAS